MVQCLYVAALLLVSLHAAAASAVYRCDSGGKISYGSVPCTGGTVLTPATGGSAGNGQPDAALLRQKSLADQLARERQQREAREEREQQKAAARRLHCDKLRLHKKWRDEDAARASASARAKLQSQARRSAEELALSCPS
jgi:hypothetical protein